MVPQIAEVRDFPRSPAAFATNHRAMYWQSPEGINFWPYVFMNKWLFEDNLDQNPPRAARAAALIAASFYDAFIASQDGKFAYWYIRPPARAIDHPAFPGSELSELPCEPFHVFGHQVGDSGLSLPGSRGRGSGRR